MMAGASPDNALVPVSEEYGDVYFSRQDGLAETRHVFLKGNDLPQRWEGADIFTLAELGFGTGLNFAATLDVWHETKKPGAKLIYIGFEKHPLCKDKVREALEPFADRLKTTEPYLAIYPGIFTGTVKLHAASDVTLMLIAGDVNETMPKQEFRAQCWYLDGFKPANNPQMWSDTVFKNMARLSEPCASFATFTAAGFVRRGLQEQGFVVEKTKGFGKKREMIRGYLEAS